jgi:predicted nucleotide-binding protein
LTLSEQLKEEIKELDKYLNYDYSSINPLLNEAKKISKSWSGSWLGYHSSVYYKDFGSPPRGAHFSADWGIYSDYGMLGMGSTGDWIEYNSDKVIEYIENKAGNIDLTKIRKDSLEANKLTEELKDTVLSIVHAKNLTDDKFFNKLINEVETLKILSKNDFMMSFMPKGTISTRDQKVDKKLIPPPHIIIICNIQEIKASFHTLELLKKAILKISKYLDNLDVKIVESINQTGSHIFIGHGRSNDWRDLKDFVNERLSLPWDEFNRIPVAGLSNTNRLTQMLNSSCFAFLIMSAEDEQIDGDYQARMNVIHEVGLFQGRLGFEKAIILLEDGCKEFSNIQGLGQIRYPKGNISAIFEDIRRVLEREDILQNT